MTEAAPYPFARALTVEPLTSDLARWRAVCGCGWSVTYRDRDVVRIHAARHVCLDRVIGELEYLLAAAGVEWDGDDRPLYDSLAELIRRVIA